MENERLVDLLQKELVRLDDDQKNKFRKALQKELPKAIRRAGRVATEQQVMVLTTKEIEE